VPNKKDQAIVDSYQQFIVLYEGGVVSILVDQYLTTPTTEA